MKIELNILDKQMYVMITVILLPQEIFKHDKTLSDHMEMISRVCASSLKLICSISAKSKLQEGSQLHQWASHLLQTGKRRWRRHLRLLIVNIWSTLVFQIKT